jgi:hypothetical protein
MTNTLSSDFLECALVSRSPKPPIPSFNVGCDLCGARIWVPQQAPLEPIRLCPACAKAEIDATTRHGQPISRAIHRDRLTR